MANPSEPAGKDVKPTLWTRQKGADWPGFLGPSQNSSSQERGILTNWPDQGLRVEWTAPLGEGYAAPSISRGRLYQFDRIKDEARLICRNAETGQQIWTYRYPTQYEDYYGYDGGPRCCPVIDANRVYLHGVDGQLICLDAFHGNEIWKIDTQDKYHFRQNFFGVASTPIVYGDLLLVAIGGSPKELHVDDFRDLKGNGSGIVAFDKKTGQERYAITNELASYSSPTLATIRGQPWGLYFARGGLIAFRPKTGKVAFQFPWRARILESVNASNPLVVGDEILLTECYGPGGVLLKVKDEGYERIWDDANRGREKSLQCHWNTPVYHDGFVFGSSGRNTSNAELRCVAWKTGNVRWSKRGLGRASFLKVDGHLLCLTEYGELLLVKLDPDRYHEMARWKVPGLRYPCWAAPVLAHGLLYVRGKERLVCLELIPEK